MSIAWPGGRTKLRIGKERVCWGEDSREWCLC
jgi:hypothetical protein